MNGNIADYDYQDQDDDLYRDFPNISLILILVIFVIMLICIGIYVHNKYSRNIDDDETISIHLPEEPFSSEKIYIPEICIICLEEFNTNNAITTLECSHSYHLECIKDWFENRKTTCPCCKVNILI